MRYSLYRALRVEAGERPWTEWPAPSRDRQPAALAAARTRLDVEIRFHCYVQWLAAGQWERARDGIGGIEILGDLPFAVTGDSSDVWSRQREFLLHASVGTPPDAFSETGQQWGLPPYDWNAARGTGFEWIRQRARRMAALYDGFRVDHLVGFYRTYVRPLDRTAPYFYPAAEDEQIDLGETIMRILAETTPDLFVEDLGTIPPFVRESIARLGVPGYRVFRWEQGDPATYPEASVAMTGTHDTEPLAVWWEAMTPAERRQFARLPSVGAPESPAFTAAVRDAILRALFQSGSRLVQLPIQDVFGWRDRLNEPGTIGNWNWTWMLPWPADTLSDRNDAREAAARLAQWSLESGR